MCEKYLYIFHRRCELRARIFTDHKLLSIILMFEKCGKRKKNFLDTFSFFSHQIASFPTFHLFFFFDAH